MTTEWKLFRTSNWRRMFECQNCGDVTDTDEHGPVCGRCGANYFIARVGRWHAYTEKLSFWENFLSFMGIRELERIRFEHEFK